MLKTIKNKLAQFDTPDTLLVVSLYPKKGETYSSGTTGVASYTKNLVTAMNRKVVVLADTQSKQTSSYQEKNTLVLRCFQPNTFTMWLSLLKQLLLFKQAKTVLVQFDFSMYGSMIISALLLPFLALLNILGFKVSVVSHHVVTDVKTLKGHLGIGNSWFDSIKSWLFNVAFRTFYFVLSLVTHAIIVLEDTLKSNIKNYTNNAKVVAIPHAVDTSLTPISKKEARKKLHISEKENVVIFFGFVNWFKGADLFASMYQSVDMLDGKPARFILAGGESVTLKEKAYYQHYYQDILTTIDNSHRVEITGYVPQNKIAQYFAAADLIVFPYRTFMCASGVLSLAFSYQKPFIVSEALTSMLEESDFKVAFKASKLKANQITFRLTTHSAVAVTEKVLNNGLKKKLTNVGSLMRQFRSFENNATLYEQTLFAYSTTNKSAENTSEYAYVQA